MDSYWLWSAIRRTDLGTIPCDGPEKFCRQGRKWPSGWLVCGLPYTSEYMVGSTFKLPHIIRNKVHLLRTTVFVLSSSNSVSIRKCQLQPVSIRLKTVFHASFWSLLLMLHCGQPHMLNALPPCPLLSAFCLTSVPPLCSILYGWPLTFGWVWLFSGLAFSPNYGTVCRSVTTVNYLRYAVQPKLNFTIDSW